MNHIVRILTLLFLCLASASSTAFNASYRVSSDLRVIAGEKSGEIFGSIVSPTDGDEPTYMRYQINFRPLGAEKSGGFISLTNTMFDAKASYDVVNPGFRGRTFRLSLPVGEYEITSARMSSDDGMRRINAQSKPVSVHFSVGDGEKIYLGRIVGHGTWGKGLFGMRIPNGGYFEFTDASVEDIALAQTKGTAFDHSGVRSAALQFPEGVLRAGN